MFWCRHASESKEVSSEWQAAVEQGKDVLPLLLDDTPVPSELGAFQWIDFRGAVGRSHRRELDEWAPEIEAESGITKHVDRMVGQLKVTILQRFASARKGRA